jgi:hypothetical protein
MRVLTKPYGSTYIGSKGTPIAEYDEVVDLKVLCDIKEKSELPLLISRNWTETIKGYYKDLLEGYRSFPLIKSPFEEDDYVSPLDTKLYIYELDPIDDFRFYIQIFIEDLIQDKYLLNYTSIALKELVKHSKWEKDFRDSLYLIPVPEKETTPILIIKQDNNGTTFMVFPEQKFNDGNEQKSNYGNNLLTTTYIRNNYGRNYA